MKTPTNDIDKIEASELEILRSIETQAREIREQTDELNLRIDGLSIRTAAGERKLNEVKAILRGSMVQRSRERRAVREGAN